MYSRIIEEWPRRLRSYTGVSETDKLREDIEAANPESYADQIIGRSEGRNETVREESVATGKDLNAARVNQISSTCTSVTRWKSRLMRSETVG